jgi:hypothetical protein
MKGAFCPKRRRFIYRGGRGGGASAVVWRLRRLPLVWGVVCWEGFLDLIIKLWLMFRSRHLLLWSLRTYGLREYEEGAGCAKGRRITPVHLPKVSCIVVWLFFLSRVSICWSFLRLKIDFSSWESLYLITLNPNRSKVWILASHLFTPCIFNT